jgi:GNAT superfamily N-acetyltransferase
MTAELRIRPASLEDAAWLIPLSSRLHDFGPPPWRPRDQMDRAVAAAIESALERDGPDAAVFVAEKPSDGSPQGFVHVHSAKDYFTGEAHGHVSDLVVSSHAEGRGVGRALMAAAERWSLAQGHRLLTLNVFGENHRARSLYERLGYLVDTTKMVKTLRP